MNTQKITTSIKSEMMIVTINRPSVRNCVDGETADLLAEAFHKFDADDKLKVAILTGSQGHFCAGADLKAIAGDDPSKANRFDPEGDGPMGPTWMNLSKPVIAAISGYCVAGGLELSTWCDLRIADKTAVFGVYCRRFGVPLIDGGTVRLPRLIGMSHAMDMILTGRSVDAQEAKHIGLVNRLVEPGQALIEAEKLANELCEFPQLCMRNDRRSAYQQWGLSEAEAIKNEFSLGMKTVQSGETKLGASRFKSGKGRHGSFGMD